MRLNSMVSKTNEQALEAAIQKHLTGISLEELQVGESPESYNDNLYLLGHADDFDAQYALDTKFFWEFLEQTQKDELEKIQRNNPTFDVSGSAGEQ